MMKSGKPSVVGIIAEYNPFHKGHLYHLEKAKELTGAEYAVVVMSGNFVQRGGPAVFDKYLRADMALTAGADLVLELPCPFATGSAEDFALGSVALLDSLGVTDTLVFGSECGDTALLTRIAAALSRETPRFQSALRQGLKTGMTFPAARCAALAACGTEDISLSGGQALPDSDTVERVLSSPNNILGVEYCKALVNRGSAIQPVALLRKGSGYHDLAIAEDLSSASAIRHALLSEGLKPGGASSIKHQIPDGLQHLYAKGLPVYSDDFSLLLHGAVLRLSLEQLPLSAYADVSEVLAARISDSFLTFSPFEEKIKQLKTKQYTYTRISRALLHILLGITKEQMELYKAGSAAPYARILGFRKSSSELLSNIKKRGDIPLITKTADAAGLLNGTARNLFAQDLACSHLYQAVAENKYHVRLKNEYTRSLIIR